MTTGIDTPARYGAVQTPDPLAVVAYGLAVFPIPAGSKVPTLKDWPNRCVSDPALISRRWPAGANIGVGCKANRLLGVDLDRHHEDADGVDTFAQLCQKHGEHWPATLTVRTPSGGLHLYFRAPQTRQLGNTSNRLGPGVDTRGPGKGNDGGYLVGPGSVVDGHPYLVVRDMPIQPLPGWLLDLLDPPYQPPVNRQHKVAVPQATDRYVTRALEGEVQRVMDAQPGERNDQLNRAAFVLGTLVGAGMLAQDHAETALRDAADAIGLVSDDGERQVLSTIQSGLRAGIRKPRTTRGSK